MGFVVLSEIFHSCRPNHEAESGKNWRCQEEIMPDFPSAELGCLLLTWSRLEPTREKTGKKPTPRVLRRDIINESFRVCSDNSTLLFSLCELRPFSTLGDHFVYVPLPHIFMNYLENMVASFSRFVNMFVTFGLCSDSFFLLLFQLCKLSYFSASGHHLRIVKEGVSVP